MIKNILEDIKGIFTMRDKTKFLKANLPYLVFFYLGDIFSAHVNAYRGGNIIDRIMQGFSEIGTMRYLPSLYPRDLLSGLILALLVKFIVYSKGKNRKVFRQGKEYESARWSV